MPRKTTRSSSVGVWVSSRAPASTSKQRRQPSPKRSLSQESPLGNASLGAVSMLGSEFHLGQACRSSANANAQGTRSRPDPRKASPTVRPTKRTRKKSIPSVLETHSSASAQKNPVRAAARANADYRSLEKPANNNDRLHPIAPNHSAASTSQTQIPPDMTAAHTMMLLSTELSSKRSPVPARSPVSSKSSGASMKRSPSDKNGSNKEATTPANKKPNPSSNSTVPETVRMTPEEKERPEDVIAIHSPTLDSPLELVIGESPPYVRTNLSTEANVSHVKRELFSKEGDCDAPMAEDTKEKLLREKAVGDSKCAQEKQEPAIEQVKCDAKPSPETEEKPVKEEDRDSDVKMAQAKEEPTVEETDGGISLSQEKENTTVQAQVDREIVEEGIRKSGRRRDRAWTAKEEADLEKGIVQFGTEGEDTPRLISRFMGHSRSPSTVRWKLWELRLMKTANANTEAENDVDSSSNGDNSENATQASSDCDSNSSLKKRNGRWTEDEELRLDEGLDKYSNIAATGERNEKISAWIGSRTRKQVDNKIRIRNEILARKKKKRKLSPAQSVQLPEKERKPTYPVDPNGLYIEEEAYKYHNPPLPSECSLSGVPPNSLRPIQPPPPMSELPQTEHCEWKFDQEQRLLLADFTKNKTSTMHPTDETFLLAMMERSDVTIIMDGLLDKSTLNPRVWSTEHIDAVMGDSFFHKFRRFDKLVDENGVTSYEERDEMCSMKVERYLDYLRHRALCLTQQGHSGAAMEKSLLASDSKLTDPTIDFPAIPRKTTIKAKQEASPIVLNNDIPQTKVNPEDFDQTQSTNSTTEERKFKYIDHTKLSHEIDVVDTALYMIDVDINRSLPFLYDDFLKCFAYPNMLPGGKYCMMNPVAPTARPFMGPNLYITPPASFTHFHQDGHGTVDSGHLCLSGCNEIVLLRRLTERHKKHALMLLTGETVGTHMNFFNGLYEEPHGDGLGPKPKWPSMSQIDSCREMGYCPTVCTLRPGQLIHLGKGRLHAFRKMSTSKLEESDCHYSIRKQVVAERSLREGEEENCISIAWDWMFRGVTPSGIHREMSHVLEAATLNGRQRKLSLAIPELCLLRLASCNTQEEALPEDHEKKIYPLLSGLSSDQPKNRTSDQLTVLRGILPCLTHVVSEQRRVLKKANKSKSKLKTKKYEYGYGEKLSLAKRPNSADNPNRCPMDPFGNTDFNCRLCHKELSNVYYHCDGCELLLAKDFNICSLCHRQGKHRSNIQMHPLNNSDRSDVNHTGHYHCHSRKSDCRCNAVKCNNCSYCSSCSCRCHTWFTVHQRFYDADDLSALLQKAQDFVKHHECPNNSKYLDDPSLVHTRLNETTINDV